MLKLRDVSTQIPNQDVIIENTSAPNGKAENVPEDLGLPHLTSKQMTTDISDLVSCPMRDI